MIIPEISSDDHITLVHNHSLESAEAIALSKAFTSARVRHMKKHLPDSKASIDVVFDVRGQTLASGAKEILSVSELMVRNVSFLEK